MAETATISGTVKKGIIQLINLMRAPTETTMDTGAAAPCIAAEISADGAAWDGDDRDTRMAIVE